MATCGPCGSEARDVAVAAKIGLGLRDGARSAGTTAITIVGVLVVAFLAYSVGVDVVGQVVGLGYGSVGSDASLLGVLLLTAVLFAVVVADAYVVHWLVHTCFRRDRFLADPNGKRSQAEIMWRTLGTGDRKAQLDRIADADAQAATQGVAAVVVHRDFDPFIGAGDRRGTAFVAVSLEPSTDETKPPQRIDVLGLHDQISRAMAGLRASTSLGPGSRLAGLDIGEQVLASSDELVTHLMSTAGSRILPARGRPPVPTMDLTAARELADDPAEWVRYYRCYRIETWERDLIPSTYIHIGTDQRNLYFERVHCVLMPIDDRFRDIDQPANDVVPFAGAIVSLFLLPATVPSRIRGLWGRSPISELPGEIVPDRYGASRSLRELATDSTTYRRYFQLADVQRYQKIVDRVLERSIGAYLKDHGYSTGEFQRAFSTTINDFRGADISNSAVGPNARTSNAGRNPDDNGPQPMAAAKG